MSYYAWSQSKTATDSEETEWFPSLDEYTPGFSVDDWLNLLNDKEVFDENSLIVIQRIYEMGGQATCKELSVQYGHDSGFYNIVSTKLAIRIHKKTNCPLIKDELSKDSKWWPILYRGHRAGKEIKGAYVWKLRDELKDAIDYWEDARNDKNRRYWLYAPGENACYWDEFYENEIMAIGWDRMGDLRQYQNREELLQKLQESNQTTVSQNTNSLQLWNFAFLMKPGDVVFCKKGMHYIIGCGIVTSNYVYDDEREKYKNVRAVKWTNKGEWYRSDQIVMKTLTDITDNKPYIDELIKLVGFNNDEQNNNETTMPCNLSYTKSSFLKEVFITESEYDKLRSLVLRKKNVILQGAPGVGKTYSAKRLAYSIIGEKNDDRICMVQFHQSYSYEDFIMGYRPNDSGGFTPTKGVFYRFCETAWNDTDNDYFFIIDEINRGNLSKIFGELLMLIESDKRGKEHQLQLVYGGKPFYIPENLHIIGMMNTADRSLAMIDYALRRRFSFYTMQPAFENADKNGFGDYTGKVECKLYHTVIARIKDLNNAIRKDSTLGKGFEIGHSYFAPEDTSVIDDEWVRNVVEFEIIPLIEEYWFDNDKKLDEWTKALYQAIGEDYDS